MISLGYAIAITSFSCLSTSLWYTLYSYVLKSYQYEPEFTSRLVAALHAVLAVLFSLVCMAQGPDALKSPGGANTPMQVVTVTVSVGYFAYDLWWCIAHQPDDRVMLIHHIVSLSALAYILLSGVSGTEATAGLFSLEFTNPLLQLRWFLRKWELDKGLMYMGVEAVFLVLFLVLRLGYGSKLTLSVVTTPRVSSPVKIVTLLLYLISLVFIGHMVLFVYRKHISRTRSPHCDYTCGDGCQHVSPPPDSRGLKGE